MLRNDKFRFESPDESRTNLTRFLNENVFSGRKPLSTTAAQLLSVFQFVNQNIDFLGLHEQFTFQQFVAAFCEGNCTAEHELLKREVLTDEQVGDLYNVEQMISDSKLDSLLVPLYNGSVNPLIYQLMRALVSQLFTAKQIPEEDEFVAERVYPVKKYGRPRPVKTESYSSDSSSGEDEEEEEEEEVEESSPSQRSRRSGTRNSKNSTSSRS